MKIATAVFVWTKVNVVDGEGVITPTMVMVPHPRYAKLCARQFEENAEYPLHPIEERSYASHVGYFAAIKAGFDTLPESIADRWPSATHMRKWLLCEVGFFEEKEFECYSEANARKLAMLVRTEDEYARIMIRGSMVIVRRAKSQSLGSMKKEEFEESKKAVLELLEQLIDVPRGSLKREAGRSA